MALMWSKHEGYMMPRVPVWNGRKRVTYHHVRKITPERIYVAAGGYFDIDGKRHDGDLQIPREIVADLHKLVRVHGDGERWEAMPVVPTIGGVKI